jgi:hypothetical protein
MAWRRRFDEAFTAAMALMALWTLIEIARAVAERLAR